MNEKKKDVKTRHSVAEEDTSCLLPRTDNLDPKLTPPLPPLSLGVPFLTVVGPPLCPTPSRQERVRAACGSGKHSLASLGTGQAIREFNWLWLKKKETLDIQLKATNPHFHAKGMHFIPKGAADDWDANSSWGEFEGSSYLSPGGIPKARWCGGMQSNISSNFPGNSQSMWLCWSISASISFSPQTLHHSLETPLNPNQLNAVPRCFLCSERGLGGLAGTFPDAPRCTSLAEFPAKPPSG